MERGADGSLLGGGARRRKAIPSAPQQPTGKRNGGTAARDERDEASDAASASLGRDEASDAASASLGDVASGATTGGEWSDELLSATDGVRMRRRAIMVQVTSKRPLLVRDGASLKSTPLGYLPPQAILTMIEERIDANGDVRACGACARACATMGPPQHSPSRDSPIAPPASHHTSPDAESATCYPGRAHA